MAMNIEKIYNSTEFKIKCIEHDAVFRCNSEDLHPVGNHRYEYMCPVCGERHTVHSLNVTEMRVYDLDVDPDREDLPINQRKRFDEKAKEYAGRVQKAERDIKFLKKRTTHLFKKVTKNVAEAAEKMANKITE